MLGIAAQQLLYRTIEDFHTPADWFSYMYGDSNGIIYRAVINNGYSQNHYGTSSLGKAEFANVANCYVSMNSFYRTREMTKSTGRAVPYLKRINALWVDIDCYKKGLRKEDVLQSLEDEYFGMVIPEPTFVIDSGRGLYLIWKLRNEDRNALPRWTKVQKYLTDKLSVLGSDPACVDAARILRVPFSLNTKSGTTVSILEFNDLTYSIYDITREYEIMGSPLSYRIKSNKTDTTKCATKAQQQYAYALKEKLGLPETALPDFSNFTETRNWIADKRKLCYAPQDSSAAKIYSFGRHFGRKKMLRACCEDIETLMKMRTGENCKREIALFLYRYFLREMKYGSKEALERTLQLNNGLDYPLDPCYVEKATASADRRYKTGVPYAYKRSTIIKVLEITNEELVCLQYLSLSLSEKDRRRQKNRTTYKNRLSRAGKELKEDAIEKRRASLFAMLQKGHTAKEIQAALNISRATYHRDLQALKAAEEPEKDIPKTAVKIKNKPTRKDCLHVQTDKHNGVAEPVSANNKFWFLVVSQKLSPLFILMNSFAVPNGRYENIYQGYILLWLIKKKSGDRG